MVFVFRKSRHSDQLLQPGIAADGMTSRPPILSCSLSDSGILGPPAATMMPSYGRMLRPSLGAIVMQNMDILIAEIGQSGSGLLRELTDPLYRVDVAGNFSEHGCRIARSGSDLKDLLTALQRQRLRHEGDNVRLGNCLIRFDRQRGVLVGKFMQLLRQNASRGTLRMALRTNSERTPRAKIALSTISWRKPESLW